jgi:tRNA dimethylallyltransferase
MPKVVAIVGPTAVGKSDLAMRLADVIRGEIVSGDSRHVYKYLDIGTNKPSPGDRNHIGHHLLDIIYPDEEYSLAFYRRDAATAIQGIGERKLVPYLVGGSGLYIRALLENWQVPEVAPDQKFRSTVEEEARKFGISILYDRLVKIDAIEAEHIGPTNLRRIIRALELYRATGSTPTQLKIKGDRAYNYLIIGLTRERDRLYNSINQRVDIMVKSGLIDEVYQLNAQGYNKELPSMSSIGYREIGQYLDGRLTLAEAVELIKVGTHRFARHQYAWFKPLNDSIRWIDCSSDPLPEALESVRRFHEDSDI